MNPKQREEQVKAFKERVSLTDEDKITAQTMYIRRVFVEENITLHFPLEGWRRDDCFEQAQLQKILQDKQVALVVERELPWAIGGHKTVEDMMKSPDYKYNGFGDICKDVQQDMLQAGYKPVILLSEEEV